MLRRHQSREARRTGGAPSNYIRELVEKWAPGELA